MHACKIDRSRKIRYTFFIKNGSRYHVNSTIAVVVTYNRLDLLKEGIDALLLQTVPCDILIVDNASTDDTPLWAGEFCKTHPSVFYENTGANLGGAGGFNYGMRCGVELGYDYVWIMDDDAIAKPDALEELQKADGLLRAEKPDLSYGFLASVVYWTDGELCQMNRQRTKTHYLLKEDVEDALAKEELIPIETATFVSLLIPAKTILKVGLPIKEFFIWSDDVEYTVRITIRNKMPSYIVPKSGIIHKTKNNAGSDIVMDDAERIDRYRYAIRNGNYAYRHYSFRQYCVYLYNLAAKWILVWLRSKDHKLKRSWVIVSSFLKGLFFHPKVEYVNEKDLKK